MALSILEGAIKSRPLETIDRNGPHVGRIRLVVVDSHPLVRWALTKVASERDDLAVVGEADSAQQAQSVVYALAPDVVTIECTSADSEGWALTSTLRERYPTMGLVILVAEASDDMLFRALDLGASAFVSKSAPIADVMAAVGHAAAAPASFSAAGLAAAMRRRQERSGQAALSAREQQILVLLHDGLSVPEIASRLFVSLSTAKTYVARMYDKLGARNRAQALMAAVRLGLLEEQFNRPVSAM